MVKNEIVHFDIQLLESLFKFEVNLIKTLNK